MSKSFRDLTAFKLAVDLAVIVYRCTADFPKYELYGMSAQMRRAAVSVVSNIAEGQGRVTRGEFRQFLSQARGSLYELDAQSIVSARLDYLALDDLTVLSRQIKRTSAAVRGLIDYVR